MGTHTQYSMGQYSWPIWVKEYCWASSASWTGLEVTSGQCFLGRNLDLHEIYFDSWTCTQECNTSFKQRSVWPDLEIYRNLGILLKLLATINLHKSPTFLGNFMERCQNLQFFYWNHFWATFIDIWWFFSGHTCKDIGTLKLFGNSL